MMAIYTYKCNSCNMTIDLSLSISEFLSLSDSEHFDNMKCSSCLNNVKFTRIFGNTSSKISKDKETLLMEIKDEARRITEKVNSGDRNMIRQVYGEEI